MACPDVDLCVDAVVPDHAGVSQEGFASQGCSIGSVHRRFCRHTRYAHRPSTGVEVSVLCSFSLLHDVPQQWVQPKVMAGCSGHGMQCCPVIRAGQGDAYVMPQFSVAAQEQH